MSEVEYKTESTLTAFAREFLQRDFRLSFLYADSRDENKLSGVEALGQADLVVISVRRRALPTGQLDLFRQFVGSGKPVVGIRTASHGFSLRTGDVPAGGGVWPEFDRDVLGGNYRGHHSNKGDGGYVTFVRVVPEAASHPILKGVPADEFRVRSSLYKTSPLGPGAAPLMMGRGEEGSPHEPVAWTNIPLGGGRVFYTSLGAPEDFAMPGFQRLLFNGIYWAGGLASPEVSAGGTGK
jgi:type 1 glutamine amidotransferase